MGKHLKLVLMVDEKLCELLVLHHRMTEQVNEEFDLYNPRSKMNTKLSCDSRNVTWIVAGSQSEFQG